MRSAKIFDDWRKPLRKAGKDPFGDVPSEDISKKALDDMLVGDDTEASAVVHSAIEEFAQELAHVTRRFLADQGMGQDRAHRGRRRLSRQPAR